MWLQNFLLNPPQVSSAKYDLTSVMGGVTLPVKREAKHLAHLATNQEQNIHILSTKSKVERHV